MSFDVWVYQCTSEKHQLALGILENSRPSMDVESGTLEKRVRRQKPIFLCAVVVVIQAALTILVLSFYKSLNKLSSYGTSLLLSSILCGLSQSLYQLSTKQFRPDNVAKFHVWGVLLGAWTKFWTTELAYKFDRPHAKLFWDQLLGNPVGVFMFTCLNALWEGYNLDLYVERNLQQALKASLVIWPVASFIQFYVLDDNHIFLFNVFVNFIWNLVLSLLA